MLFMEGGPGHMDTFDPKPKLNALHKTESKSTRGLETGFKFYVGSPFKSRKVGQAGLEMSDQWQHLPEVADELCNYRGGTAESLNHPEALFHMNTGSRLGADPALGAWVNYGLGSVNQNLPGYVVMTELRYRRVDRATGATVFCRDTFRARACVRPVRPSSICTHRPTRRAHTSGRLSTN